MNALVVLAIILCLLMIWVGGKKGARSFISLFLNFGVIILTVFFMTDPNASPIVLTLIACTIISWVNLFYVNEVNRKTQTAFLATIITTVILLFGIELMTESMMIQGFSEEETEEMDAFSSYIGLNFVKIATSVIIMSTIGAIIDVAISITSPMQEVMYHHPRIGRKDLFMSGLTIGRDILGTNTNTLFFAFIGSYLALLLLFKDLSYSFGEIVNLKVFGMEVMMILWAGIGIALVIPIAAGLHAIYLTWMRDKSSDAS